MREASSQIPELERRIFSLSEPSDRNQSRLDFEASKELRDMIFSTRNLFGVSFRLIQFLCERAEIDSRVNDGSSVTLRY